MLISRQTPAIAGSIKVVRCHDCADIVVKLPDVEYPSYLGYGAHTAKGEIGIQIVIDENGNVKSAKGISGHSFFRQMLEKASLTAKFRPTLVDAKAVTKKAVIFYQITPSNTTLNLPILNGRATVLPKPKYTQQLADLCAYGRVEIEVLLDETGAVLETKPLSGDELIFPIAIEAAKQAKFSIPSNQRIRSRGIMVYIVPTENECIDAGIVNKKPISRPTPLYIQHLNVPEEIEARVRIVIDESGQVISALAVSGHPLVRNLLESAATRTKFAPSMIGGPIRVKAILVYKVKPNRTVELAGAAEKR